MLSIDQFHQLLSTFTDTLKTQHSSTQAKDDNPLALARLEHYIIQDLSFKFDGEQDKLIPWVKKFHAMRSSALWHEVTYMMISNKTYDLLMDFTNIKEHQIRTQAKDRWTIENQIKSLKQDHPHLFYPRILGNVISKSVTDEFYMTLQTYAGIKLSMDGPYLLWLILNHFHTSTITYKECIKSGIRNHTLTIDHNDDVQTYFIWLCQQLNILASTNLNDSDNNNNLIEPIFLQLLTTKSTRLCHIVEDWHLEYHNEERSFTLLSHRCSRLQMQGTPVH
jgi:hypothetical protein